MQDFKGYYLSLLLFLITGLSFSQVNKDSLQEQIDLEEEFSLKNYKADPWDRMIIEINHTGLLNIPSNIKMSWKSIGVNFALMFDKPLGKSNFSIGYGIGIYSHNFHSNADFVTRFDSTKKAIVTDMIPKVNSYTINRFAQKILEVPLELRFRTKTINKFKIMLGGKFGYVISDFRKVFDDVGKNKIYDTKNLNYLRYGVVFRIGVEQFCFTASYYFSELFKKGLGPQGITPYSVGIAIIPY
ncbi:MAG: outer membrane beta-barrel protein [Bacteroidia bacterium]